MKASDLIAQLQHGLKLYGDREVVFANYADFDGTPLESFEPVDGYVSHETTLDGKPVIVLWDE